MQPAVEQWQDTPNLLHSATVLDANRTGAFVVELPDQIASTSPILSGSSRRQPCRQYTVKLWIGNSFSVTFYLTTRKFDSSLTADWDAISTVDLVEQLESTFQTPAKVNKILYRPDLSIKTPTRKAALGVPDEIVISNLKRDHLDKARKKIQGLHSSYAYKLASTFVFVFACHTEDFCSHSVNHLY